MIDAARRTDPRAWWVGLVLALVAPVAISVAWTLGFHTLGWRSTATASISYDVAMGLGLAGVAILPVRRRWRFVIALAYLPAMTLTLACWALMFSCYVLHDCV